MQLKDLLAFARVAELSSLSAAARLLSLPKSSVSRSLARLEVEAGAALLDRSTRHVRLTDAGRLLLPYAQRILVDVDYARGALEGLTGVPRGTLRVSAPVAFSVALLAPMLPSFLSSHPEVRVLLEVENRRVVMPVEDVDIAIRVGTLPPSDLVARRLMVTEAWTCASPAYLSSRGVPTHVEDLREHTLIGYADQPSTWVFTLPGGEVRSMVCRPVHAASDSAALQPLLIGGAGIGRLPDFIAAPAVASGDLTRLLPNMVGELLEIHALYPSHRSLSAKVRVFIDALVIYLATIQPPRTTPS